MITALLEEKETVFRGGALRNIMAVELDSRAFKALSSKTRVALLKKMGAKPRSLSSLAGEAGLSVQATDEHLRKLAGAGLVEKTKTAKWAYYHLTDSGRSLVQPNRQPIYLLMGASILLLLASALTIMQNSSFAATAPAFQDTGNSEAPRMMAAPKPAGSQPELTAAALPAAKGATITAETQNQAAQGTAITADAGPNQAGQSAAAADTELKTTSAQKASTSEAGQKLDAAPISANPPATAAATTQSRSQFPWAEVFGFAGFSALFAAAVLWLRQKNSTGN